MPVGEGSIRRAAGKAEGGRKKNAEDGEVIEVKRAEKAETKAEAAAGQGKGSGGRRKSAERAGTSAGGKKSPEAGRKTAAPKRGEKAVSESGEQENNYEAYGIGQPLPTYLL